MGTCKLFKTTPGTSPFLLVTRRLTWLLARVDHILGLDSSMEMINIVVQLGSLAGFGFSLKFPVSTGEYLVNNSISASLGLLERLETRTS